MGEFDLCVGDIQGGAGGRQLNDVLDVLLRAVSGSVAESVSGEGEVRILGRGASLRVFDYSRDTRGIPSFLRQVPWVVSISLVGDGGGWPDSLELARFLYEGFEGMDGFHLVLLHDEEELVKCNVQDPSLSELADFRY